MLATSGRTVAAPPGRMPFSVEMCIRDRSCKVYVKPEEDAAYYVINKVSGKLEL